MGRRQSCAALVVNGGGLMDMDALKGLKGRLFKSVAEAAGGMEALSRLRLAPESYGTTRTALTDPPGLVLISLKTSDMDPFEICRLVKEGLPEAFVVMVGSREEPGGLSFGMDGALADDFLLWPFSPEELEARMKLLSRKGPAAPGPESGAAADGLPNIDEFIDGFLVLEVVTVSRQSAIYKVLDRKAGRILALKLLTAREAGRAAKRFEREAGIMSRMDHPNVIKFRGKGVHKGCPYILMDYVDGADLEDYLLVRGVPPLDVFFKVAGEVARGVEALHTQGVVHKDIKLANILLPCAGGPATLTDLGTASEGRVAEASSSGGLNFIEGTPIYMAPEIFAGEEPGVRSDIYSYGAAMYHFLTGSPPFAGRNPSEAVGEKSEFAPKSARLLRPEVSEELDILLVERCMATEPSSRPSSIGEIVERLGQIDVKRLAGAASKSGFTVLLVDDDQSVLDTLKSLLRREPYELLCAKGAQEALAIMSGRKVHLALSDFRMPGMNGVELARTIRERWPETVRIVFSGQADTETVVAAINAGHVYKFLVKSWFREDLKQNIRLALEQYSLQERNRELDGLLTERNRELSEINVGLERKIKERMEELLGARGRLERQCKGLVGALLKIMELQSEDLSAHGRRVGLFAKALAELSGASGDLSLEIETAGYLHDIGKISLHSEIGGRLSKDEESLLMRRHPSIGGRILESIPDFHAVSEMVRQHHESYDGRGYPEGLSGDAICFGARVLAVADAFDRLVRPEGTQIVRKMQFVEEAMGKLSGRRLDPSLTRIFMEGLAANLHASFDQEGPS